MNWIDINDTSGLPLPSGEWEEVEMPEDDPRTWVCKSSNEILLKLKTGELELVRAEYQSCDDALPWFCGFDNSRAGDGHTVDEVLKYMPIEP